ncbi:hypothetical protein [Halomonas sp. LBP4]|uniref:hypothetical protein n=1 Tax=Halomonas sp. LBP4 TaxID=2044917 RepID=UPI0015E8E083|nr:hypothetical protein [Halomonas sp. LBP4]
MKRRRFLVGATVVVGGVGTVVVGGVGTVLAPTILEIPPYRFLSDPRIETGVDPESTTS